jgi:hypothetical protein
MSENTKPTRHDNHAWKRIWVFATFISMLVCVLWQGQAEHITKNWWESGWKVLLCVLCCTHTHIHRVVPRNLQQKHVLS